MTQPPNDATTPEPEGPPEGALTPTPEDLPEPPTSALSDAADGPASATPGSADPADAVTPEVPPAGGMPPPPAAPYPTASAPPPYPGSNAFPPPPPVGGGSAFPPPPPSGSAFPPPPQSGDAFPPPPPVGGAYATSGLKPHRATLDLVMGILGLLLCQILAIPAFAMSRNDLAEMDAGRMDPSGRGTTNAARILGLIGIALLVLDIVSLGIVFVIAVFGTVSQS